MNIASLFARIGIDYEEKKMDNLLEQIKSVKIGLGIAAISVGAFIAGLKKITDDSFQSSLNLKKFSLETGANVEELQRWSAVADEVSGSGAAVAESIKAIVANQENIKLGKGNISGYAMLGINPNQDPFQILEQLRTKTRGLSQGMKKNIMEQMGVSKDLLGTLELTNAEFDAMKAKAFILPSGTVAMIEKARESTKQLGNAVDYMKGLIVAGLSPNIIKLNDKIMQWIRNNKEGLVKTIQAVFPWITKFVTAIIHTASMINTIIKGTIGWKVAIIALTAVWAILNRTMLFSPIGAITAGIVLLIAVLDDMWTYFNDPTTESFFGNMAKSTEAWLAPIREVLEIMKELNDIWTGKKTVATVQNENLIKNFNAAELSKAKWKAGIGGAGDIFNMANKPFNMTAPQGYVEVTVHQTINGVNVDYEEIKKASKAGIEEGMKKQLKKADAMAGGKNQ